MTSVKSSNIEALAFRAQCVFENGIAKPGDDFRLEYLKRLKNQFPDEQIVEKTADPLPEEIKKICGQLIKNTNTHFERSTFLAETIKLIPQDTPPQFRTIFNEIIDTNASQIRSLPNYYWRDLLSVRPDFRKNLVAHEQAEANSPKPLILKATPCSNSVEWEKHELEIGRYRIPVFLPLDKTYPWAVFEEYLESGFMFLQAVLGPDEFSKLLSPGKNRPDLSLFLMSPVAKAEEAFNNCGIRTDDRGGQYDSSKHAISLFFKQPTTFHTWSGKDTRGRPENFLQHFSAWPFEAFLHEVGHAYASVYFDQDTQFKTVMGRYFDWLWEQTIPDEKERGAVKSIVTSRSWAKEGREKLATTNKVPGYEIFLPESPLPDKTESYALSTENELFAQLFQEYFLTRINRLSPDLAEKKDAHFKARHRLMAAYFENPLGPKNNVWSLKMIQQIFKEEGIELGFIKLETEKRDPSKIERDQKEKARLELGVKVELGVTGFLGHHNSDFLEFAVRPGIWMGNAIFGIGLGYAHRRALNEGQITNHPAPTGHPVPSGQIPSTVVSHNIESGLYFGLIERPDIRMQLFASGIFNISDSGAHIKKMDNLDDLPPAYGVDLGGGCTFMYNIYPWISAEALVSAAYTSIEVGDEGHTGSSSVDVLRWRASLGIKVDFVSFFLHKKFSE